MKVIQAISIILLAAVVLAAAPAAADRAQYVSGTVSAVPMHTRGTLDFADAKLSFRYRDAVFTVPAAHISGVENGRPGGIAGKLKRLPGIITFSKTDHLTVTFKDEKGAVQTMTFATTKDLVNRTLPQVQAAIPKSAERTAAGGPAPGVSEDWWGDKYWRTNRNQSKWPSAKPSENAPE